MMHPPGIKGNFLIFDLRKKLMPSWRMVEPVRMGWKGGVRKRTQDKRNRRMGLFISFAFLKGHLCDDSNPYFLR